jgi:murein DD-endopeptidase MepM/ murein hydrolase activator NlpD
MFPKGNSRYTNLMKKAILLEAVLLLCAGILLAKENIPTAVDSGAANHQGILLKDDYITWVDFDVTYEALCQAYDWDVDTHDTKNPVNWIDLLAYTAAITGGEFKEHALDTLNKAAKKLAAGEATLEVLTKDLKYFPYYKEAYTAVLGGMVGTFREEKADEEGKLTYREVYGLKAYFPLGAGFAYEHYDDFGAGRSFGYQRKHLGHDMLGAIGTPIVAIESGYVEALGWNEYGGWRIGIRSLDKKRYYYYAHLRQNYPYAENLAVGSRVTAGDVIGYMGHTGYSSEENVNNIKVVHLHWGLELVFDEAQKESDNEIWIDVYPLTRFLAKHTQQVKKEGDTKEWVRTTHIIEP